MTHSDSCILAVDAGGTSLKAALIPLDGEILRDDSPPAPMKHPAQASSDNLTSRTFFSVPVHSDGGRDEILSAYAEVGRKGGETASRESLSVCRAAVCIPGPFDYSGGRSLMAHKYQEIYGISLIPALQEGIGADCPVTFLHDSTAFLLGAVSTVSDESRRICGITIGTGLGFACMRNGRIRQNPSGGPALSIYACPYLGGTAEDYVSKRGILRRYREETGLPENSVLTVADIALRARAGDAIALKTFQDTGFHLGNILLPILKEHGYDTVLLGGAISKSADLFLPQLSEILARVSASAYPAACIDLAPLWGAARYNAELACR